MSATLAVAPPTLRYDDAGGGVAALEKPVTVLLAPVTANGAPLGPAALAGFGYAVQRRAASGAAPEVWDDATRAWVPDQPGAAAKPTALAYRDGDANPWQGTLVAAGMKDGVGAPAITKARNGYPIYSIRGTFTGKDGSVGTGPQSANLTFVGAADGNLLVVGPGDDEQLDQATLGRLLLKAPSRQVIGGLTVTRDSPGAVVRLDNAAGASVVLRADGSIELHPAAGRGVVISGDVETEHITYLPAGGTVKQNLT